MGFVQALRTGSSRVIGYFRDVIGELKRVRWPNRQELVSYTIVVITTVLVMAVLLYLFDLLFSLFLNAIGLGTR
ncbi:MAG: preprotein translocase subunit SecE [Alicyclobacillaceae bacterium]|nr:preprotein translocase subunit SecE [Alicyclobacillaceae bacterium]